MITHKKRAFVIACLLLAISFTFGYVSRYPDLNHKALVAESATVADTIAMWPILKVKAYDPLWKKIAYTTINWCNDNKKGMAFGLVIASLLATLMQLIRFKPSSSRLRNTFYGSLLGTPLGVCVNCAAPVFKGMLQSRRIEMALALMFASPTLNVVVVTMAFTLLPLYMAVTKLAFNLMVIFLLVPFLAKHLASLPVKDIVALESLVAQQAQGPTQAIRESWLEALLGFARGFGRQLLSLGVKTVPLMLLAGFVGAALSHIVPLDLLRGSNSIPAFMIAAVVGIILPVPMAFDVVLTHALYAAGLPSSMAMILLLSLGVFSFYSFLIVKQSASTRWALSIAAALLLMILPLGLLAPTLHENFYMAPNIAAYRDLTRASPQAARAEPSAPAVSSPAKAWPASRSESKNGLKIAAFPFWPRTAGETSFLPREGPSIGLTRGFVYTIRDYPDPFWVGRGTAAGDYDRDGWPDLAFGSDEGIILYRNIGGRFESGGEIAPTLKDKRIFAVAFVDLNNDGWLDLFASSFARGNYYVLNQEGRFSGEALPISNGNGVLTVAPAFADLDHNSYLDIFNGNMVLGIATGFRAYEKGRSNSLLMNDKLSFELKPVSGGEGETMASILSDINNDGLMDLYQNNDFIVPDQLSLGQADGQWQHVEGPAAAAFATPMFSMSVDTGDIDNDLRQDLLVTGTISAKQDLGQQTIDGAKPEVYKKAKDSLAYCEKIQDPFYRENCARNRKSEHIVPFHRLKNLDVNDCQKLEGSEERDACLLSMMWMIVTNNDDGVSCQERYGFDPKILEVCYLMRAAGPYLNAAQYPLAAPQIDRAVLYRSAADGGLARVPSDRFDHPGGWTWSSKFVDIDNDGWLDIVNAEGAVRKGEWGFNVYLRNEGEGRFVQRQFSAGFVNDFNLFSFALIDFDRDGDMDIIGNSAEGPIQVYENRTAQTAQSIAFRLNWPAAEGNRLGIGAKILIKDDKGRQQMREIKAGGGYMSFDAPEAYFGLADAAEVRELTLISPRGTRHEYKIELEAGKLYDITFETASGSAK